MESAFSDQRDDLIKGCGLVNRLRGGTIFAASFELVQRRGVPFSPGTRNRVDEGRSRP
jgi:hypothetical protein